MLYFSVQIYWTNRCLAYRSKQITDTGLRYWNLGCSAGDTFIHLDSVMFRTSGSWKNNAAADPSKVGKKSQNVFMTFLDPFIAKNFQVRFRKKPVQAI